MKKTFNEYQRFVARLFFSLRDRRRLPTKPRPCRHKKDIRHSGAGIHKDRVAGSRKGRRMNYIIRRELQDERITASINAAKQEYKNGEIIEARDRLMEIVAALDEFIDTESE